MLQFCSTCAAPPAGCTRNLNWCGASPPAPAVKKVMVVPVFCGVARFDVSATLVTGAWVDDLRHLRRGLRRIHRDARTAGPHDHRVGARRRRLPGVGRRGAPVLQHLRRATGRLHEELELVRRHTAGAIGDEGNRRAGVLWARDGRGQGRTRNLRGWRRVDLSSNE